MREQRKVLFLCTGNYYRSRFAEDWFNHLAKMQALDWSAESRGLAEEPLLWRNPGPMSPEAIRELQKRGAQASSVRWPRGLQPGEWREFARIVALNRPEHEPLIRARFPDLQEVIYWDIRDLGEEQSTSALTRLALRVEELFRNLVGR